MGNLKCASCLSGRVWECAYYGQCGQGGVNSIPDLFSNIDPDNSDALDLQMVGQATESEIREGTSPDNGSGYKPGLPVREVNTYKEDSAIKDQQSTGRKRAAVMYPLDEEAECEWARQKNCGGGTNPITGCLGNKQEARHHGPDKNTLNNEPGNVHRICHSCHNRWHARNDPDYVWAQIYPSHQPEDASFDELLASEASWAGKVLKKVKD